MGCDWTSLYLSCEPLPEEYLSSPAARPPASPAASTAAVLPAFERKGVYRFKFSITAGDKLIAAKEDKGHEFRTECGNWGWQSFIRRDVCFEHAAVRRLDAFTITCEVTSQPEPPRLPDPVPRTLLPTDLVETVGRLLDHESYSDVRSTATLPKRIPSLMCLRLSSASPCPPSQVEFVIAPRRRKASAAAGRSIFANKTLLSRADYYATLLNSGFAEDLQAGVATLSLPDEDASMAPAASTDLPELEDSDRSDAGESSDGSDGEQDDDSDDDAGHGLSTSSPTPTPSSLLSTPGSPRKEQTSTAATDAAAVAAGKPTSGAGVLRASPELASSPRQVEAGKLAELAPRTRDAGGPRKTRVIIRVRQAIGLGLTRLPADDSLVPFTQDASYPSYFALLYFLYTETITFAPVTSSFLHSVPAGPDASSDSNGPGSEPAAAPRPSHAQQASTSSSYRSFTSSTEHVPPGASTGSSRYRAAARLRTEWIDAWVQMHPGRPRPASAKSLFVLADKMGLGVLKAKAFKCRLLPSFPPLRPMPAASSRIAHLTPSDGLPFPPPPPRPPGPGRQSSSRVSRWRRLPTRPLPT